MFLIGLPSEDADLRSRLSHATRVSSERRQHLILDAETVPVILAQSRPPATIGEKIDRLLSLLASRAGTNYLSVIRFNSHLDWPLIEARDHVEVEGLLRFAEELGLLRPNSLVLTIEGWQRAEALRRNPIESRRVFVAMSFDQSLNDAWTIGVAPGIERSGYYSAHRVDTEQHNDKIDDRIIAEIRRSAMVVADFTHHRGGVYFEAGFALGLGRPVIWTCRKDQIGGAHFDTRQYNHITWEDERELADALDLRIRALYLPVGWMS